MNIRKYLKKCLFSCAIFMLAGLLAIDAGAQGKISLDEAVGQVRSKTGARILSAETFRQKNSVEHRIRILTPDGRVRRLRIDGNTGRTLRKNNSKR